MWCWSESGAYCVRIPTRKRPECAQFEREKSMTRYFPPNGSADAVRTRPSAWSRSLFPPARIKTRSGGFTAASERVGAGDAVARVEVAVIEVGVVEAELLDPHARAGREIAC